MKKPALNLGAYKDVRDRDYDPTQLCDHCRVKLAGVLLACKGETGNIFEFGGHLFRVVCLK